MTPLWAAALLLPGAPMEKQHQAVLDYANDHGYQVRTITNHPIAVVQLATDRLIDVVVVAFEPSMSTGRATEQVRHVVEAAGVRFEAVRGDRHHRTRVDVADLVVDMRNRGADLPTIAHLLDLSQTAVSAYLRIPAGVR